MTNRFAVMLFLAFVVCAPWTDASQGPKERVAELIRTLEKGTPEQHWNALIDLGDLGPNAAPAVVRMVELLRSKNPDTRLASCMALGRVGKSAVPPLTQLLDDPEIEVRILACWALGLNGKEAQPAVDGLLRVAKMEHAPLRRRATIALGQIAGEPEKVVPVLIELLGDEKYTSREDTVDAVGRFGDAAVPHLKKKLNVGSTAARLAIVRCLAKSGASAWPELAPLVLAKDAEISRGVVAALDATGSSESVIIEALANALENSDYETILLANEAIAKRGAKARAAAPALVNAMFGENALNHVRALDTLRAIDHDPRADLRGKLDAKDRRTRALAGYLLYARLNDKEKTLEPMSEALELERSDLQREVAKILGHQNLQAKKVIPILAHYLQAEKEVEDRFRVLQALCPLGEKEDAAVHAIALALKDTDSVLRFDAARFLGGLAPRSRISLPALRAALDERDPRTRDMIQSTIALLEKK